MRFDALGLSEPLLKAVTKQGYTIPSPIQIKAIPAILSGNDVMAAAQTGTGKTAGFTLPLLELLSKGTRAKPKQVRALILTPTRELAAQIESSVVTYGRYLTLRSAVVFGGVKINPQKEKLHKGIDILVATPGRLLDLYQQKALRFDQLEVMVFDEADRMLDMGFIHDIRKILAFLPKKRQNLLFSATFSNEIRTLAKSMVNQPVEISVSPRNTTTSNVEQWIHPVDKKRKTALLTQLIKDNEWQQVLVFSRTKHGANRLARSLEKSGIKAAAIHGDKTQNARTKALANFKNGSVKVLVATDIAARGLDIEQLPHVVNVDLPNVPEDYVHRIGRTGRAGHQGQAVSLVSDDELKQLAAIERLIKHVLVRKLVDGFEPEHNVPETTLRVASAKKKKPSSNARRRSKAKRTIGAGKSQGKTKAQGNQPANMAKASRKQRKRHKSQNRAHGESSPLKRDAL